MKPSSARTACAAICCALGPLALIPARGQAKEVALFHGTLAGSWKTTLTLGAGFRALDADPELVGAGAGVSGELPGASGAVGVNDDAQLNFPKAWDKYSAPMTAVSDLSLLHVGTRQGIFVRARAWYDLTLEGHNFSHGNAPNRFTHDARLSDEEFAGAARFSGVDVYDAYLFGNYKLGAEQLQLRLGRQTFDWGEGIFYRGINAVQPYDQAWLTTAGAPILNGGKLPVNRVYANLQVGRLTFDGFYNLEFRPSVLPGCGTYFQPLDNGINKGCNNPTLAGVPDQEFLGTRNYYTGRLAPVGFFANGAANPALDRRPMSGQPGRHSGYGVSGHAFIESIATELGVYYSHYTSPTSINAAVAGVTALDMSINTMFPEGVEAYAVSASTGVRNVTLQGQITRFLHLPAHYGAPAYIIGAASGTGPLGWMRDECGPSADHPDGAECKTWFPLNVTEAQAGGTWQFGELVGLGDATLTGEIDYQWNTNLPAIEGPRPYRLGRFGNFGEASWANAQGYVCNPGPLDNGLVNRCEVDGFVTKRSWGYRLRASTVLPRSPKLTFVPSLTWSHDPSGVSAESSHLEGRWSVEAALRTLLYQDYYVDVAAVRYNPNARWDPLQDKGQYTVALGVNW